MIVIIKTHGKHVDQRKYMCMNHEKAQLCVVAIVTIIHLPVSNREKNQTRIITPSEYMNTRKPKTIIGATVTPYEIHCVVVFPHKLSISDKHLQCTPRP